MGNRETAGKRMVDVMSEIEHESSFRRWELLRSRYFFIYLVSALMLFQAIVVVVFDVPSPEQVPVAQEQEVLVLVTQIQEILPDTQVLELALPATQVQEIKPEIIEIQIPVTKWLSRQEPQVLIPEPETQILEIEVLVPQWLSRHVPEMQGLRIQLPVTLLQKIQPETQWLGIQMTLAQLQEIQGTEGLIFVAQIPKARILSNWPFWATIAYLVFYAVYLQFYVKPTKHRLSRQACIFIAKTTAQSLGQGDTVKASLSMDKLLSTLSDFVKQKLVSLVNIKVAPQKLMHVAPERIPRKAVFQAIQTSRDTWWFQQSLHDLAHGLSADMEKGYLSAYKFLVWLDKETESYQKSYSGSFFERHPTFKTVLTYVGPIIAALVALAGLVVQSLT